MYFLEAIFMYFKYVYFENKNKETCGSQTVI